MIRFFWHGTINNHQVHLFFRNQIEQQPSSEIMDAKYQSISMARNLGTCGINTQQEE